jgi:hypothetical protein
MTNPHNSLHRAVVSRINGAGFVVTESGKAVSPGILSYMIGDGTAPFRKNLRAPDPPRVRAPLAADRPD